MIKLMSSAALCALALAAALPASAQTVGEITVTGRYGAGADVRSLSAPVSFADLDLTTKADQDELQMRIKTTARGLCNDLGEANVASGVTPACDSAATKEAWSQAKMAIASATPRTAPMAMSMPMPEAPPMAAPAATTYSAPASYTTKTVTNGPVADTPENRAMYGQPMSNAGKRTAPSGN